MTRAMKEYRRQPYSLPRTYANERTNAEAGPSNLAALPPANPSGGTSETSADAEKHNSKTEEDAAPVSNFYCSRILRVSERAFGARSSTLQAPECRAQGGAGTKNR